MREVILKTENLSKQYRLGLVGTGTISHDLNLWWHTIRGKENPYLKIGDSNDRTIKGESDYVWALKDINFEVRRGEVLGIIGKNGAGKSTLLKILAKVTGPSTGVVKSNGSIASLLEVGTGFHPEMTGRENIYLNGAILGMTKSEIAEKMEEIVTFSGCERYIDTPTKRYSSGMTVRLAFAVAAHLEPDILIIDEVLAVGDAEFQKKAIGKMQDISQQGGRTVLFVSHNMTAVKNLCDTAIVLDKGNIVFKGNTDKSLEFYAQLCSENSFKSNQHINTKNQIEVKDIVIKNKDRKVLTNQTLFLGEKIKIEFVVKLINFTGNLSVSIDIRNDKLELISHVTNEDSGLLIKCSKESDEMNIVIETDKLLFIPGLYKMDLWFGIESQETIYEVKNFFVFDLEQGDYTKRTNSLPKHAKVYLDTNWSFKNI